MYTSMYMYLWNVFIRVRILARDTNIVVTYLKIQDPFSTLKIGQK